MIATDCVPHQVLEYALGATAGTDPASAAARSQPPPPEALASLLSLTVGLTGAVYLLPMASVHGRWLGGGTHEPCTDAEQRSPADLAHATEALHPGLLALFPPLAAAGAPVPNGAQRPVVILDVPLLVETGRSDVEVVVVVDTHEHHQHERLVTQRGLDPADATARMSRQASRADRLNRADLVIDNTGDLDQLEREVERVWQELCARSAPTGIASEE